MLAAISLYAFGLILLGLLTLLATIAVPFVSLRRERPRKGLAYSIRMVPLAFVRSDARERVQLFFDGRSVPSAVLATVRIRNSGNTPVVPEDFERPLEVKLADTLLDLQVGYADPAELRPATKTDAHTVMVEPLLLNPGDSFDLMLVLDNTSQRPVISGRIAGVRHLTEDIPQRTRNHIFGLDKRAVLAMLTFMLIGYITLGIGLFSLWKTVRREHVVVHLTSGRTLCALHVVRDGANYRIETTTGKVIVFAPGIKSMTAKPC